MLEEVLTTARSNPKIDPVMHVWGWEVPIYLDLGGLTAGIMFFAALMILLRKQSETPFVSHKSMLLAPVVLSVGMATLFLDLEYKYHVFRFYTSFQPTSPMSWGSWLLMIVYPLSFLFILATLRSGYPAIAGFVDRFSLGRRVTDVSERFLNPVAALSALAAIGLGAYTGILLSSLTARPFWNTGVLAPLFLVSGLSTGAAVAVMGGHLVSGRGKETQLFVKFNMALIALECLLVAFWVINLRTSSSAHQEAARHVVGGEYTRDFWLYFVGLGLVAPLLAYGLNLRAQRIWPYLAPLLVLYGGFMLRHVTVEVGQLTTWIEYSNQFDPGLLERLVP